MNPVATPQPDPAPGGEVVLFQVIDDLKERAEAGKQKYGGYLMTHNGRSAVWDAYEEILDFVMYFRQHIIEQEIPAYPKIHVPQETLNVIENTFRLLRDSQKNYIKENEEWKKEVDAQLAYLSTNMAYMAAKQGAKPLRVSGYPRTEE